MLSRSWRPRRLAELARMIAMTVHSIEKPHFPKMLRNGG
jgi:hypothetical protein